ncbi:MULTISPECIES: hypothetical protein [unclassified Mycobacterium]|uniref:hypothetical protein n=1 Tax=unclassified Mycobacterium TaxID=2642494 RepID=UPI000800CAE2|nr:MULTISPECIES: hypothetical protein [unclassified Mycobacterium]OBB48202.1 hypothetical protein A5752_22205 [Mycobacterium sp. 852002-51961_SCH5331710]OBG84204.1 hypothetical protein A5698_05560 [Mycobacterium sp. E136]
MRMTGVAVGVVAAAVTGIGLTGAAQATDNEWGLNGRYTATSNGEYAKTNDRFRDEASLRSTWTITTTCSYPTECTGTVVSDFGWTAPIYKTGGVWYVKHTVEDWIPCPDGTAAPGLQVFRFVPVNEDGSLTDPASTTLAGEDQTTGPSGACGVSKPVFINMPFKLVKNDA